MTRKKEGGFTLMEMSIVVVIIALVAGFGLSVVTGGSSMLESTRRGSTNQKLDALEDALMAYRTMYNRLPCPANPSLANTDPNYGVEAANMGSCIGGTPAAIFSDATHSVVEGAVPFKQLGLPEEFMYDGWGRKFAYAVNQNVTAANAMTGQSLSEQCGISVTDAGDAAGNRTSGAVYALVSFGADGHGGYLKSGSRNNAGVTNTDEQTNCHCDVNANATTYAASYVEKDISLDASDAAHPFSDYVRFKERWQMMTYDDTYMTGGSPVCSLGFRADGMIANGYSGNRRVTVADVNGDGIPDLIIGSGAGGIAVVFGTKNGFPNPLPLNSLTGTNGFTIAYGGNIWAGDINGDGYADVIDCWIPGCYVLFGHANPWPASVDPTTLADGTHGIKLSTSGGSFGVNIMTTGDINGDGIADFVFDDSSSNNRMYILFGQKCGGTSSGYAACPSGTVDPSGSGNFFQADGTYGFYWSNNIVADLSANAFPFAWGDVNGDGIQDLVFLESDAATRGNVYILFGHTGSWAAQLGNTLSTMDDGIHGTYFYANFFTSNFGVSHAVGDINGDGYPELIISGEDVTYGSGWHNAAYIIPTHGLTWKACGGASSGYPACAASYEIGSMIAGGTAFWIGNDQSSGYNFLYMTIADVNGDGINDLILACPYCTTDGPYGVVYVLYGKSGAFSNWNLAATPLNGTNGFTIQCSYAADAEYCGNYLATADLNGDGIADIIMNNQYGTTSAGADSGYTYVLFGSKQAGHFSNPFPLSKIQ